MHESPSEYNVFQKTGHPGRWVGATAVGTDDVSFSGRAVYGGVVISGSVDQTSGQLLAGQCDQVIQLSNSGTIPANVLAPGIVHEFSVAYVEGGTAGTVYVLKRNG